MHIYYHADFDGIASSVILMDYFRRKAKKRITGLTPVDYNSFKNWRQTRLTARDIAVVDFAYHPQAIYWFDHHGTAIRDLPIFDSIASKLFSGRHLWFNYNYDSCAGWIANVLVNHYDFTPSANYDELIHWADVIDSASYQSVDQIIACREPALQIEMALRGEISRECMNKVVKELSRRSMGEVINIDPIKASFSKMHKQQNIALEEFGNAVSLDGPVATFEYLNHNYPHNRFFPYYFYPDAIYAAGIVGLQSGFKIEIGRNPWGKEGKEFDVGGFCAANGGGGHFRVGGIRVDTLDKARSILARGIEQIKSTVSGNPA
jgi:hypothetical protein